MAASLASVGINAAAIAGSAAIATITGIATSASDDGATLVNDLLQALTSPTLCYIPIACDSIEENNESDVANTMVIAQMSGDKGYITDNVAPRPRTWDIHGYITALIPLLEDYLPVKPTLLLQRLTLNAAFQSRDLVPFKSDTGEIVDVVVTRLKIKSLANAQNAYEISATVQEVNMLDTTTAVNSLDLEGVAALSIPEQTLVNLGNCAIGATLGAVAPAIKTAIEQEPVIKEEVDELLDKVGI